MTETHTIAISGYCSEGPDRDRSLSQDSTSMKPKGKRILTNQSTEEGLSWIPEMCGPPIIKESDDSDTNEPKSYEVTTTIEITTATSDNLLSIPSTTIATSNSLDTLTESTLSGPSSPSNLSSVTLVGSTGSGSFERTDSITTEVSSTATVTTTTVSAASESSQSKFGTAPTAPLPERIRPKVTADSTKTVITPSLPPTVTTTHYVETSGTITTKESQPKAIEIDEPPRAKTRSASTVSTLQPHKTLMDRRPSAGANIQIPHAALCQHRHSLQLNGDTGLPRVRNSR